MSSRSLLPFAAVLMGGLLATGCKSTPKEPYSAPKKSRDYYSVNKESASFVVETFRKGRQFTRDHDRKKGRWSDARAYNAKIQKESLAFFWDALKAGEAESWKLAWTEELPWLLKSQQGFAESARFGFLDSGD